MGAGSVKLPRLRRWQFLLLLALIAGAGALAFNTSRDAGTPLPVARHKPAPPVGSYTLKRYASGRTDFTMQTDAGRFGLRVGGTALADMPYDLPLYPGAHLLESTSMRGAGASESGSIVRFESADVPNRVITYYRRRSREALLHIVTDEAIGDAQLLAAIHPSRSDGGFQLVVRARSGGGSTASLTSGFGVDVSAEPAPNPELKLIDPGDNAVPAF